MHQPTISASAAFQALQKHHAEAGQWQLRDLFAADPERFRRYSVEAAGLFLDYSKNRLNHATLGLLLDLARERKVEQQRDALFAGKKINVTEQRAALHTALRMPRDSSLRIDGQDVVKDVHAVLDRLKRCSDDIRSGAWRGHSGKMITDIVNIGIGGSDLGPQMACAALRACSHPRLKMHFVSNVDGHNLQAVLATLDPASTLFIVASKTFTTQDTMLNAQSARNWFLASADLNALPRHFVAVSTNTEAVKAFGIDPANMFPFWDWVGGRYSVWSAIGLSVCIAIGHENFSEFLAGAHAMDAHFKTAPLAANMPVLLALIGIWYRDFFASASQLIVSYHHDMKHFSAHLQQLEMESNGKRTTIDGSMLDVASCPIIWGDVGTNCQHAYFQLLHQGADMIPTDFITALTPSHDFPGHHATLLANCFAQSEALMRGRSADEVLADMQAQGKSNTEIAALLPHKTFPGNRPSNTLLMQALTPAALGALIALYEHKTFVQGVLWGINSFDQWGVELGKVLAKDIEAELTGNSSPHRHDSSTNGLIALAAAALK